jgi:hypothetical protein
MAGELARELSQFPFTKLRPANFRVEIAGLTERELHARPVKIWVETEDIAKIVKIAGAARIIRIYPHINFVYLETYESTRVTCQERSCAFSLERRACES